MNIVLSILIMLDIALLSINNYFSLSPLKDIEFGLQGVIESGQYKSYSDLEANCDFISYCNFLSNFKQGGMILQALIILDIFTLSLVIIQNFLLQKILRNVINAKETMSNCKKNVLKVFAHGKSLIFFHPVLVNLGFVSWVICSKISELSNVIILHEGMIILIIQSFLSLLTLAYYIWIINSIKRRNTRLLKSTIYTKEDLSISI